MEDKEQKAQDIGVGAVVFSDLSNNRIKDIDFSWEEALNFDGSNVLMCSTHMQEHARY